MKRIILSLTLAIATLQLVAGPVITEADRQRAADLVSKMTLEEKCLLLAGQTDGFHTAAIERLGIPAIRLADGPQGVRNGTCSTYFPCGLAVAASWNRNIAYNVGSGIGVDAGERGVGIMLCPGVNIYRSALCGRNFEYMGEDPYLASETASKYISGIQDNGAIATIKHFAANNQEYQRHQVNSIIDERTLNEIYFATFRKAVEQAHVGALMTSYNPLNGLHAAENPELIKENLRKWGHEGIVMSDWTSTYTTYGCLRSGLDLEMPAGRMMTYDAIRPLVENGLVSVGEIDEKCLHILQTLSAFGLLDKALEGKNDVAVNEDSRSKAYAAALEAPVLLKNEQVLPMKKGSIVVMGPCADIIPYGGGSGAMSPIAGTTTTLFEGLQQLGKKFKVSYVSGPSNAQLVKSADLVICAVGFDHVVEGEGHDRPYALPDGQNEMILKAASLNPNVLVVAYSGGEFNVAPWIDKVKGLMMAWYCGQEGGKALAAIISGAVSPSGRLPFTFWGNINANPATKFYKPAQIPDWALKKLKSWEPYTQTNYDEGQFIEWGLKKKAMDWNAFNNSIYGEGVFLGYRAEGRKGVAKPMFPFGYGLSYSKFDYSGISAARNADGGFDLSFTVTNSGPVDAAEVAQVYVAPVDPALPRPAKELKGYEKVSLRKGESKVVTISLAPSAFAYWSVDSHDWKVDAGKYRLLVGASSGDIRLDTEVGVDR